MSRRVSFPSGEFCTFEAVNPLDKYTPLYRNVRLVPGHVIRKRFGYKPLTGFAPPNDEPCGIFKDWSGSIFHLHQGSAYEDFVDVSSYLAAVDCAVSNASSELYSSVAAYKMRYFAKRGERIVKRRTDESYGGSDPTWERVGLPKAPTPTASAAGTGGSVDAGTRKYKVCYYNSTDKIRGWWSDASAAITLATADNVTVNTGITAIPNDPTNPAFVDKVIIARQYANGSGFYEIDTVDISSLIAAGGVYTDTLADSAVAMGTMVWDTWRPCYDEVSKEQKGCDVVAFIGGRMLYANFEWAPAMIEISRPIYVEEIISSIVVGDAQAQIVGIYDIQGRVIVVKQDGVFELLEYQDNVWGFRKLYNVGALLKNCCCSHNDAIFLFSIDRRFFIITRDSISEIGVGFVQPKSDLLCRLVVPCPQQTEVWFVFDDAGFSGGRREIFAWSMAGNTWRNYEGVEIVSGFISEDGILTFQNKLANVEVFGKVGTDGLSSTTGLSETFSLSGGVSSSPIIGVQESIVDTADYGVPVYCISGTDVSPGFVGFAKTTTSATKTIELDRVVTLPADAIITFGVIHSYLAIAVDEAVATEKRELISEVAVQHREIISSEEFVSPQINLVASMNRSVPSWDYSDYSGGKTTGTGFTSAAFNVDGNVIHILLGDTLNWADIGIQNVFVSSGAEKRSSGAYP